MKLLLAAGANVDGHIPSKVPLREAVSHNHPDAVRILLDAKADVSMVADTLFISACSGNVDMVKLLISTGVDVNTRDTSGVTCLHCIASVCNPDDGTWTLKKETNMFQQRQNTHPCDFPGVVNVLVDAKADVSALGLGAHTMDITPLHVAAISTNAEAVNALLAVGARPNDLYGNKDCALTTSCKQGCLDAVTALLAAGADPNHVRTDGLTPLYLAAEHDHIEIVSVLISAGADVNYVHNDSTLLEIEDINDDIASLLEDAGAMPFVDSIVHSSELFTGSVEDDNVEFLEDKVEGAAEKDKENAMKYAVEVGNVSIVKLLLAAGVSPSTRFAAGDLLYQASALGHTDVVKVLIDADADVTFKDEDGMTALQHAAQRKHRDVVVLLLAKVKELKNAYK
jgi:ankyrin repeat protein